MGIWGGFAQGLRASRSADDDFWYKPVGYPTLAGVPVSAESAFKYSAVYQGIRLISENIASLSKRVYERTEGRGKRDVPIHELEPMLRRRVSPRMTAFEWFQSMTAAAIGWGNGYSLRRYDRRGQLVGLEYWYPGAVTVTVSPSTGRPIYKYRNPWTSDETIHTADEVYHFRGLGLDGVCGLSVIALARQSIGTGQAMENHAGRFFGSGLQLRGLLQTDQTLNEDQARRNADTFNQAYGGAAGVGKIAVTDRGLKFSPLTMSAEDAQFIESRDFQVRDFCRWLNLSETLLRIASRPPYSTPEQVLIEFMEITIRPWVSRWESSLNGELIADPERFFVEFNMDSVHRADLSTRSGYYASAIQNGYRTRNEVREMENLEPLEGLDEPLTPSNLQGGKGDEKEPTPTNEGAPRQSSGEAAEEPEARAPALLRSLAVVAVQREIQAIRKQATPAHLADADGWRTWVERFYGRHAGYLSESLAVPLAAVRPYVTHHRAELLAEGLGILTTWAETAVPELCHLRASRED